MTKGLRILNVSRLYLLLGPYAAHAAVHRPGTAVDALGRLLCTGQFLGNPLRSSRGTPTAGNMGAILGLFSCHTESYDVSWGGVLILVPGKATRRAAHRGSKVIRYFSSACASALRARCTESNV